VPGHEANPTQPSWEEVLAALECETAELEAGLRNGVMPSNILPWQPPLMPSLPVELAARAQALVQQQLALKQRLSLELAAAPAVVRTRAPGKTTPEPLLIDLRA
jgi:hypothetical protein